MPFYRRHVLAGLELGVFGSRRTSSGGEYGESWHDDRVVPSHSFKFTAVLQAAPGCDRPVLIRIEKQASHNYRPTDRVIGELANEWAFAAAQLGMRNEP
jgi:prolyl oligopeptidase PreP (S9A serine peptidase family)